MKDKCIKKKLRGNWTELTCGKYKVQLKHFSKKSENGIDKGKVSKLWMKDIKSNKEVINFDRGWDKRITSKTPKDAKAVYNKIIREFN